MDLIKIIKGKVLIKNKRVNFNGYLREIINKIFCSFKNKYKGNLILTLDKSGTESLLILIIAIEAYFRNLTNFEKNILDELEVGDIVYYEGKKCEYLGVENIYGQNKFGLRYKSRKTNNIELEDSRWIDIKYLYKISKYYGESETLNTMFETQSKKEYSGKILFQKLLDLDCENLYGVIEEQVIVVFESKRYMEYILENIKIEIENKLYDFTQVFPCKYYSDVDNGTDLKGNKLKEKELFIFASRLDIAKELLINDENCRTLILLGEDTYKNYLGGVFDNIVNKLVHKRLDKLIIYNSFDSINNVSRILDYDIDCYSWNKSILVDRIKDKSEIYVDEKDEINNYFKALVNNIVIKDKDINLAILEVRKNLIKLINSRERIINKESFIRIGFKIYKLLQTIIFPIEKYEEFDREKFCFHKYLNSLKDILSENNLYITNVNFLKPIIDALEELYKILYFDNPKLKYLKQNSNYKSTIVCGNSIEEEFLNKEFALEKIEVITIDKLDAYFENKKLIFPSFYDKSKKYQIPYSQKNNVCNILYDSNIIEYNSKVRHFNKSIDRISEINLLKYHDVSIFNKFDYIDEIEFNDVYLIRKDTKEHDNTKSEVVEEFIKEKDETEDDEALIENYIRSNTKEDYDPEYEYDIESLFNIGTQNSKNALSIVNQGSGIVKKKIIFTNGNYCYLTQKYIALCIDKEGKSVEKSIDILKVGEKIIFIDEKSHTDLNLLFEKIINSEIFKKMYKEHYENMRYWKNALKGYMYKYNMDYTSISQELKMFNINKTNIAVRQWISFDGIIGPRELEFYKAIAKITGDKKLRENWKDIYESNNIIRGFRSQFRRAFKSMVKDSVISKMQEDNPVEYLVKSVFGNLNEYANVVEIKSIENILEDRAYVKANSLISNL